MAWGEPPPAPNACFSPCKKWASTEPLHLSLNCQRHSSVPPSSKALVLERQVRVPARETRVVSASAFLSLPLLLGNSALGLESIAAIFLSLQS